MTLASVFAAIAALDVSPGSLNPTVYTYSALPQFNDSADLPARLLMPQQDRGTEAGDFEHIALGSTTRADRRIVDLMLLAKVGAGQGMAEHLANLVTYADEYESVVHSNRSLSLVSAECINLQINIGQFTYTEVEYFGCEVILTVADFA